MAVPVFTFYRREMMSDHHHYTIADVTDDEIQYIQDYNEAFYSDLEFPISEDTDE